MEKSLKASLINSIKSLNYSLFKEEYKIYEEKYGFLEFCIYSELLKIGLKNKEDAHKFILFMKDEDVFIDDKIVLFSGFETIEFSSIFEKIGVNFQNFDTGNTLLHTLVLGKNYKALNFYSKKDIDCFFDIENNEGLKPIDILFTNTELFDDDFIFRTSSILKKSTENHFREKDNTLFRVIKKQIFVDGIINYKSIDLIIKIFSLNKLYLILNMGFILKDFDSLSVREENLIKEMKAHYNMI